MLEPIRIDLQSEGAPVGEYIARGQVRERHDAQGATASGHTALIERPDVVEIGEVGHRQRAEGIQRARAAANGLGDLLQIRVSAQRTEVRPAVQPDHGRDQARDLGGYRGPAQGRVIRVARDGAARGHRVAVQAHRERALHVGRQTRRAQRGRGRLRDRQAVLGQCRNHLRDIALRGRKARNELLRGQKLMVLRIARRVQRREQRLRGIDVGQPAEPR